VLRGLLPTKEVAGEEQCSSLFSHTLEDTDSRGWELGEMS